MATIVALGDSTTAGTPGFLSPVEAPPDGRGDIRSQYAYWLRAAHPNWQVHNCGVNGERTDQIAARVARDVYGARADLVVVLAGVNDIYQGRSIAEVIAGLEALYRRVLEAPLAVVTATIVPFDTATPAQNAAMQSVNAWIARRAADDPRLWYCDTRRAVARPDAPDLLVDSPDGLHPSVDGYRHMAAALDPVLVEALG